MKSLREGEKVEEEEMERTRMASLLLLLSTGGEADKTHHKTKPMARGFECKTCNRRFPSFQALGGHRTSHKRPSVTKVHGDQRKSLKLKPRVHQCPVCGSEFPMGQALGGHMRRHKPTAEALPQSHNEKKAGAGKALLLDLNLPPCVNELGLWPLGSGGTGFF